MRFYASSGNWSLLTAEATRQSGGSGHHRVSGDTYVPQSLRRCGVSGKRPKQQTPGRAVGAGAWSVSRAASPPAQPVRLASKYIQMSLSRFAAAAHVGVVRGEPGTPPAAAAHRACPEPGQARSQRQRPQPPLAGGRLRSGAGPRAVPAIMRGASSPRGTL